MSINKRRMIVLNLADIIKHLKPNLILFVPIAAVSVYHILDKIMLGFFTVV